MYTCKRKPDKERLLAAIRGEKTGEVPNFEIQINARSVSHFLGRSIDKGVWELDPEASVELAHKIGHDAVPCAVLHWSLPRASVQTESDLENIQFPEKDKLRARVEPFLEAVQGTDLALILCVSGPFTASTLAAAPNRTESFMFMIYDQPELVEKMMDIQTQYTLRVIDAVGDMPFDVFYIGDDIGGLVSPDFIEQVWGSRFASIIEHAKDTDKPVICHCCGDQTDLLPHYARWKVDAVHPLQPKYNDIYEVHREYPELTLFGNVDIDLLTRGTKGEVRSDVLNHLDHLSGTGRYIGCSSHSIIDSIPPENYEVMIQTIQEFTC